MEYYKLGHIKTFELEITTFCNAFCGSCARNINGGELNPNLTPAHMDFETWKCIVTQENLKFIKCINFNGNLGDCSMHPQFLDMLEYLYTIKPELTITMSTNGGARNIKFWKELAHILSKFRSHQVNFSIDGNKETNHLYRRGVVWEKLMENANAFNNAGGISRWWCIVFDHNKDQIDELMALAGENGFGAFQTRVNHTPEGIYMKKYKNFDEFHISSPSNKVWKKLYWGKIFRFKHMNIINGNIFSPVFRNENPYDCEFGERGILSIDNHGRAWPCCYFYAQSINPNSPEKITIEKYKLFNSFKVNNLNKILKEFRKDLLESWTTTPHFVCQRCTQKFQLK